jgi:hypothetical protein
MFDNVTDRGTNSIKWTYPRSGASETIEVIWWPNAYWFASNFWDKITRLLSDDSIQPCLPQGCMLSSDIFQGFMSKFFSIMMLLLSILIKLFYARLTPLTIAIFMTCWADASRKCIFSSTIQTCYLCKSGGQLWFILVALVIDKCNVCFHP